MFKARSFWTGIGLGFVVGAIVLQLMLLGSGEKTEVPAPLQHDLDFHELEQMAEQLGYVLLPDDVTWISSQQVEADWEQREHEVREEALENASTVRSFIIVPGMSSDEVADMLLQLGLIRDKELFNSLLTENDLHRSLQARIYIFKDEPTMEQIIDKITTK